MICEKVHSLIKFNNSVYCHVVISGEDKPRQVDILDIKNKEIVTNYLATVGGVIPWIRLEFGFTPFTINM